ncbi:kelch-like protein 5 [Glossina fuscipes]|uniref:Kelch-like protein 5 n=1 Tax=Glossina fuscipes TaxID=7396 RepID=A0A9C5ZKW3_9MUSC|nr:kelch-like protein 5 [Glossina fuscipes]
MTAKNECEVYDISKNKLVSIPSMNENRQENAAVSYNGVVYSVGGSELNTAECYDPASKRWSYIAPMNYDLEDFGICTYNGLIYVLGGKFNFIVESYDPATNKWHLCQDIPVDMTLYSNRATVAENCIYSLTQKSNGNSLFRFDPRNGKWYNLHKMLRPSGQYELISYDRTLFAIGAKDCKRLDIRVKKWEPIPSMLSNRYGFSAVIAAKDIYVLGGRERRSPELITSVERLNIDNNEWTTVNSIQIENYSVGTAIFSGDFDFNKNIY